MARYYHSNMILAGNTTLSGSGTVTLVDSGNPQNYIYGASATDVLTNAQTIQGTGTIGNNSMALNNTGTIDANDADHGLVINTSNGTTNTGTLEATNGGTLQLSTDTFNNVGGTIKALNGSKVQLANGAIIEGGTLSTDSGHGSTIGTLASSSATLDGLTMGTLNNAGAFVASNNSTTNLQGTINNTGSISLNSAGNVVYLQLKGNTTLTGSGTVTLTPFSGLNDYIFGQTNTITLTNVNNTIAGSGTIGNGSMILVNQTGGVINANAAGKSLVVSVSTATGEVYGTNTGLMESTASNATNGPSALVLYGGTINNAGGTIEALNGGVVQLEQGVTIQGGTLTTDSGHGSLVETVFGDRSILLDGIDAGRTEEFRRILGGQQQYCLCARGHQQHRLDHSQRFVLPELSGAEGQYHAVRRGYRYLGRLGKPAELHLRPVRDLCPDQPADHPGIGRHWRRPDGIGQLGDNRRQQCGPWPWRSIRAVEPRIPAPWKPSTAQLCS